MSRNPSKHFQYFAVLRRLSFLTLNLFPSLDLNPSCFFFFFLEEEVLKTISFGGVTMKK